VKGMKPTARLHKIRASYQFGGLRLFSGDFTASDQEVADYLLETHFPGCQPIMENAEPVRRPTEEEWLWTTTKSDGLLRVLVPSSVRGYLPTTGPLIWTTG
jgi:hypothetical protein